MKIKITKQVNKELIEMSNTLIISGKENSVEDSSFELIDTNYPVMINGKECYIIRTLCFNRNEDALLAVSKVTGEVMFPRSGEKELYASINISIDSLAIHGYSLWVDTESEGVNCCYIPKNSFDENGNHNFAEVKIDNEGRLIECNNVDAPYIYNNIVKNDIEVNIAKPKDVLKCMSFILPNNLNPEVFNNIINGL